MASKLTRSFVERVKPTRRKTKTYGAGRGGFGLTLMVKPSGAKSWYQRINIDGKAVNIGLGGYPTVSLDKARRLAAANYAKVAEGRDPRRQFAALDGPRPTATTLADCVEMVIESKREAWKDPKVMERQWRGSMRHVAALTRRPVASLTAAQALSVFQPLTDTMPAVARQVRSRLAEAVDRAIVLGLRADNPFAQIRSQLVKPKNGGTKHHASMPYADAPDALAALLAMGNTRGLALAFQVATATRPSEAQHCQWSELDMAGKVWTVPADRMKAGIEHRVPLSDAALAILARAPQGGGDGLVFPAPRGGKLSSRDTSATIKALGWCCTGHGFRSTFRDWCGATARDREIAELCLAHRIGSAVEQAYKRDDYLARRREVMEAWGAYLVG